MSATNDKRIQSINSIETHAYGLNEELIQKDDIKCNNIRKQYKNV